MRKRDYRSYSILEEDIAKEDISEEVCKKALSDDIKVLESQQGVQLEREDGASVLALEKGKALEEQSLKVQNIDTQELEEQNKNEHAISEEKIDLQEHAILQKQVSLQNQPTQKEQVLSQEKVISQEGTLQEEADAKISEGESSGVEEEKRTGKKKINLIKQAKQKLNEFQDEKLKKEAERKQLKDKADDQIKNSSMDDKSVENYYIGPKSGEVNTGNALEKDKELDFPAYKKYYQQKERSKLFKGIMGMAKLIILIMLLPLIGIVGVGILTVVGCILVAIIGSIGLGVIILGSICFMSTQISASLIGLGVAASITSMAFGGIILILFMMFIRWTIDVLKKYRRSHMRINRKENR